MHWLSVLALAGLFSSNFLARGFAPNFSPKRPFAGATKAGLATEIDVTLEKPTGTSFLPEETIERAKSGSPVEKIKLEKDGTSAFVDVYEYARKIREGEMSWEDVEKADLDTVRKTCDRFSSSEHTSLNIFSFLWHVVVLV